MNRHISCYIPFCSFKAGDTRKVTFTVYGHVKHAFSEVFKHFKAEGYGKEIGLVVDKRQLPATGKGDVWGVSRHAIMTAFSDPDVTHACVMQCDAVPCVRFVEIVRHIVEIIPENVWVCPFSMKRVVVDAHRAGNSFVIDPTGIYGVCNIFNRSVLQGIQWFENEVSPYVKFNRHDDHNLCVIAEYLNQQVWTSVPSLVDHANEVSIMGNNLNPFNKPRKASLFLGSDDPFSYQWDVTRYGHLGGRVPKGKWYEGSIDWDRAYSIKEPYIG